MGGGLAAIPLQGVRPQPMNDPMESMGNMVRLASLLQQRKMEQEMMPYRMEQVKAASEELQLRRNELQRQERERVGLSEALGDVGGDFFSDKFSSAAGKRGVSAPTIIALQKSLDDAVTSHSKRDLGDLELNQARDLEIADALDTVTDPASLAATVNWLRDRGHMKPKEAAEAIQGPFDPEAVKASALLYRGSSGVIKRAVEQAQLNAAKAAEASSQASTEKTKMDTRIKQAELDAIKNAKPEDYEALIDQFLPPDDPGTAKLNAGYKAQIRVALRGPDGIKEAKKIVEDAAAHASRLAIAIDPRIQTNRIILAGKLSDARASAGGLIPKDEEPGKKYTIDDVPTQVRPMVENVLKYQSALPPQSRLNPSAQATRWWAFTLDPNYSEELFTTRKAAVLSMNTGKDHQKLNAMNTVLGHVGRLEEAVAALENGDIRVLNQIANELGVATGSAPPVVFKTIVHRVGPELTQAYVGSGGEAAERKEAGGDFDVNGAPAQIRGAAKITAKLLASKMGSLLFDFKRAARFTPEDPRGQDLVRQFFTPEATGVMDRMFPGWEAEVEPGGKGQTGRGRQYVQYGRSADGKTSVGFTADGKLWNVSTGKELDPTTGKEK